jgi:hypothetical protein
MLVTLLFAGIKSSSHDLSCNDAVIHNDLKSCSSSSSSSAAAQFLSRYSPTTVGADEYESFFEPGSCDGSQVSAFYESLRIISETLPHEINKFTDNPNRSVQDYASIAMLFLLHIADELRLHLETHLSDSATMLSFLQKSMKSLNPLITVSDSLNIRKKWLIALYSKSLTKELSEIQRLLSNQIVSTEYPIDLWSHEISTIEGFATKASNFPNALVLYRFAIYVSSTKSLLSKISHDALSSKNPNKIHYLRLLSRLNDVAKACSEEIRYSSDIHMAFPLFDDLEAIKNTQTPLLRVIKIYAEWFPEKYLPVKTVVKS